MPALDRFNVNKLADLASKRFVLQPDLYVLYRQLDTLAGSGNFNVEQLELIEAQAELTRNKTLRYYLASLYLQLDETSRAHDLLAGSGRASREMKRYFSVLSHSRRHGLPFPKLDKDEESCIDYLDGVISSAQKMFDQYVIGYHGFSIVGNAPGDGSGIPVSDHARFYFNDYQKNTRIEDNASVHVVTPSWRQDTVARSDALCISGNNIFHRRSKVWKKFIHQKHFKAIYTLPRSLWSQLCTELDSKPSAGILMLTFIAESISLASENDTSGSRLGSGLKGYIAGFSNDDKSGVNHSYDQEPASSRHNWSSEARLFNQNVGLLREYCASLDCER